MWHGGATLGWPQRGSGWLGAVANSDRRRRLRRQPRVRRGGGDSAAVWGSGVADDVRRRAAEPMVVVVRHGDSRSSGGTLLEHDGERQRTGSVMRARLIARGSSGVGGNERGEAGEVFCCLGERKPWLGAMATASEVGRHRGGDGARFRCKNLGKSRGSGGQPVPRGLDASARGGGRGIGGGVGDNGGCRPRLARGWG